MGYLNETIDHLNFLANHLYTYDEKCVITILLIEIGIPAHGDGFDYIVDVILLYHQQSIRMSTKEIYSAVARKHGIYVTPSQVEGSVRKTIEKAYKRRDKVWECYFPEEGKPKNAEFISRMARVLDLWNGCCAAVKNSQRVDEKHNTECSICADTEKENMKISV